ncbi:MAG: flagellar hook-associated protein FlgL [Defluviitaleaceae bacterium]|nr:flagellar hook-associated protein FlgL [Defluviitaleaceae bacterium]
MRLTNVMMTNTTLMHINRNMRNLDRIVRTIETGKRIQRPSDDPIVASRALKFRTSVHENEQFQRNVDQGYAWMNVTESTFNNINRELLFEIRNLAVQGANGDNSYAEKQMIIQTMQALFDQIGHEMNATFGGNYLFSGFRTDEPPVFTADNQRDFIITQHFGLDDVSREMSFQRLVVDGGIGMLESVSELVHVLKLAYTGLSGPPVVPGFEVREFSIHDADAYQPPATNDDGIPVMHFIPETGELVLHRETASTFPREGVSVTYQKQGFRAGDINPAVYFTAREIVEATPIIPTGTNLVYNITQYFSRAASIGTDLVNGVEMLQFALVFDPYETTAPGLQPQLPPGATIDGNIVNIPAHLFETQRNISVTYAVENPPADPTNPVHIMADMRVQGVQLVRALNAQGVALPLDQVEFNRSFDMHNQGIEYEFSTNTRIAVNSLAKNVLTDKMFADFRRFFEFSNAMQVSSRSDLEQHFTAYGEAQTPPWTAEKIEENVNAQLIREGSMATYALHRQFDNMLFLIDRHLDNSTREQTMLGARMVRMELVQNRLEEDEVTYTLLTSDNEDTDLVHATILRFSAEALFMASLRANSGVVQMSLANFLR